MRTPRAHEVDGRGPVGGQRHVLGRGQHGLDQAGQLVDRLALHPQGDDEAGDLGRRGGPVEDLGHGRPGLVDREVATPGERAENRRPTAQLVELHGPAG
jgi:hypothetical protein